MVPCLKINLGPIKMNAEDIAEHSLRVNFIKNESDLVKLNGSLLVFFRKEVKACERVALESIK